MTPHAFISITFWRAREQLDEVSMPNLTSHSSGITLGTAVTGLIVSTCFAAIGAFVVFDIFGITSKSRESNAGFTPWGRWVRRKWDLPDPYMFVGWSFVAFGTAFAVFSIIDIIIALIR
jgi:hypothetical protein